MKKTLPLLNYLFPRMRDILFLGIFVSVFMLGYRMINMDGDLGRHLAIGSYILDQRTIPTQDVFSHTMAGSPLVPHEWLSEVLFAIAYRWMGFKGVVLLCAFIIASAITIVYRQAIVRSRLVVISAVLTIFVAAASSLHWLARPHIFTLLLLPIWVAGLERIREGRGKTWWVLPILMGLWANLHGAFITGFAAWFLYLFGYGWDRFWRADQEPKSPGFLKVMLLVGGCSAIATLINPAGVHLWQTSVGYLQNSYLVGHTQEYLSPNFQNMSAWPFLFMLILAMIVLGVRRNRMPAAHLLVVAAWAGMGLVSARNIPLFAVVSAPVLAETVTAWLEQESRGKRILDFEARLGEMEASLRGALWPVSAVVILTLVAQSGAWSGVLSTENAYDPQVFPVQAVDWLENHPQSGAVFNYFPWGGYLLYRSWPDTRVFIDGQTDFYGEALTRKYETVLTLSNGWRDILSEYHIHWILMPTSSELIQTLSTDSEWKVEYQDETAAVLVHRGKD